MRLDVGNNWCVLRPDGDYANLNSLLRSHLTISVEEKKFRKGPDGKPKYEGTEYRDEPLYMELEGPDDAYYFPRGLYTLMSRQLGMYGPFMDIVDHSTRDFSLAPDEVGSMDVRDVLRPEAPFSLREDQVLAVRKALLYRRGVVQMPTGCFAGDVEVVLASGETRSFRYLVENGYDDFDVVSSGPGGSLVTGRAHDPRVTKCVDGLVRVVMDTGKETLCTPDHPFMTTFGDYVPAGALVPGDRLMTCSARGGGEAVTVSHVGEVRLDEPVPVYDLTVDKYHNFAIGVGDGERGVIVHNSGKTEVMSAIISILEGRFPDVRLTVIEPTDILVNGTVDRFNRYGLNAVRYKDVRHVEDPDFNVLVAHPKALLNDTGDDSSILGGMAGVFWDECQHCKCDTWKALNRRLPGCEYALGFSALAVDEGRILESNVRAMDPEEVLIEGATGPVIVNVPMKYYTERGILATPAVLQLVNDDIGDVSFGCNDWNLLRRSAIESGGRTRLTTEAAAMFLGYGRRVLILVGTRDQAFAIASSLAVDRGLWDETAISFGSGMSFLVDPDGETRPYEGEDIIGDFDDGRFSVMVSTSHMDEGVDISNLDVVVLASGGKKDRRMVQRIGRALRRNKTGRYAYIVDFYDKGSSILQGHSGRRMRLYRDHIDIPEDLIFSKVDSVDSFVPYFRAMEGYLGDSPAERLMNALNGLAGLTGR